MDKDCILVGLQGGNSGLSRKNQRPALRSSEGTRDCALDAVDLPFLERPRRSRGCRLAKIRRHVTEMSSVTRSLSTIRKRAGFPVRRSVANARRVVTPAVAYGGAISFAFRRPRRRSSRKFPSHSFTEEKSRRWQKIDELPFILLSQVPSPPTQQNTCCVGTLKTNGNNI